MATNAFLSLASGRKTVTAAVLGGMTWLGCAAAIAADAEPDVKREFLTLCDVNRPLLLENARNHKRGSPPFYIDAYAIRALCVAWDLTRNKDYLDVCRVWSDRMVENQNAMLPRGTYDMNYGRQPGQEGGENYVADCSSIAEGVLATAIRCTDPAEKRRYLDSAEAFAKLVAERFVRSTGGVTDGWWKTSDKEWWCSTGIYGALAFELYDETGRQEYLKLGLGTIDYLNSLDIDKTKGGNSFKEYGPSSGYMYIMESYTAGLPHLDLGTKRREEALVRFAMLRALVAEAIAKPDSVDYFGQWGSKIGGLPFHLYVYARLESDSGDAVRLANHELQTAYVEWDKAFTAEWQKTPARERNRYQLGAFLAMSFAEKIAPGNIYRVSKEK